MSFDEKLEGFNTQQQEAILTEENTVVSAGAGSGKTRTLCARYLYLVTEKKLDVSSILCLTFTTKATTEMHARIYAELKKNADNPYAKKALESFQSARISTLDSVCNSIARYASRSYSITPDFRIDQTASNRLAEDVAFSFFLKNAEHPVVQKLIRSYSAERVILELFVPMLKKYASITSPTNFKAYLAQQEEIIRCEYKKSVARLHERVDRMQYIIDNAEEGEQSDDAIQKVRSVFEDNTFDLSPERPSFLYAEDEEREGEDKRQDDTTKEEFEQALKILLCISNIGLKGGRSGAVGECKKEIKAIQDEFKVFNCLANYDVRAVEAVFIFLEELEREYIEAKKAQGILSYRDVADIAHDSLKNDVPLRNYYKQSINAIMIDEFQDNNRLQRDILFLLAEKAERIEKTVPSPCELEVGKLFFVGDAKQSIYAFRGADVSVFRLLTQEMSKEIKLETNYRTERDLIDIFNTIFSYSFYSAKHREEGGNAEPSNFEAVFESLKPFKETQGLESGMEVLCVEKRGKEEGEDAWEYLSAEETEAYAIAERIKELHEREFLVQDKQSGKVRPCRWSDFAILLRTLGKQHNFEKYLKILGVPYNAISQKWIFSYAPLNDLYAVFRLALYPYEKSTYAQVLRSPFLSLSDDAFIKIILSSLPPFSSELEVMLREDGLISDAVCFECARNMFEEVQEALSSKTNAEIVQMLWYKWGYRYLLLSDASCHEFLNLYDYLFFLASEADASHLSACEFVDELSGYIEASEDVDNMDIPTNMRKEAVQIMTVHKSKGLEFPIVLIPDAQNKGLDFQMEDLIFMSEMQGMVLRTPDIFASYKKNTGELGARDTFLFEATREKEKEKLHAELKRLFYVAMTRAEVKVILSFCFERSNKEREAFRKLEEVAKMCSSETGDEKVEVSVDLFLKQNKSTEYAKTNCFSKLFLYSLHRAHFAGECNGLKMNFYHLSCKKRSSAKGFNKSGKLDLKDLAVLASSGRLEVKEYAKSAWGVARAKGSFDDKSDRMFLFEGEGGKVREAMNVGEAVHAYMEALLNGDEFDVASVGISDAQKKEIERYKDNFLSSHYGKMAMEAKVKKTEYGFITRYRDEGEQEVIRGVIDLFFEVGETVYIIDYKTDKKPSNRYKRQLQVYKKAVSDLYKHLHSERETCVKAYIFYLETGEAVEVQ